MSKGYPGSRPHASGARSQGLATVVHAGSNPRRYMAAKAASMSRESVDGPSVFDLRLDTHAAVVGDICAMGSSVGVGLTSMTASACTSSHSTALTKSTVWTT